MRTSLLLLLPVWFSLGCGAWLQNDQTEWTELGGGDDAQTAASPTASIDTPPSAITPEHVGPRTVTLMNGDTTLAFPLGLDTSPGPILVEPIGGGDPQLGFPID